MKFCSVLVTLAMAALGNAQIPVLTEYKELFRICNKGGPNSYVGVLYQGNTTTTFAYNECYPYEIGGKLAEMAVFCKSVTCYSNPNLDCSGGAVPSQGADIPAGTTLINVADFVQRIGQGAICQPINVPV